MTDRKELIFALVAVTAANFAGFALAILTRL